MVARTRKLPNRNRVNVYKEIWQISCSIPRTSTRDRDSSCEFQFLQSPLGNIFQLFGLPTTLNLHTCSQCRYMRSLIAHVKKHVISITVEMYQEKYVMTARRFTWLKSSLTHPVTHTLLHILTQS